MLFVVNGALAGYTQNDGREFVVGYESHKADIFVEDHVFLPNLYKGTNIFAFLLQSSCNIFEYRLFSRTQISLLLNSFVCPDFN